MNKEQEIKEFANDIHEVSMKVGKELVEKIRYNMQAKNEKLEINSSSYMQAEELNKIGYRKQIDVAKRIFEELVRKICHNEDISLCIQDLQLIAKDYGVDITNTAMSFGVKI